MSTAALAFLLSAPPATASVAFESRLPLLLPLHLQPDRRHLYITATLVSQPQNLYLPSTLTSPLIKSFCIVRQERKKMAL